MIVLHRDAVNLVRAGFRHEVSQTHFRTEPQAAVGVFCHGEDVALGDSAWLVRQRAKAIDPGVIAHDAGIPGRNPQAAIRAREHATNVIVRDRVGVDAIVRVGSDCVSVEPGQSAEGGYPYCATLVLRETIDGVMWEPILQAHG
nr:hypothetical protein [Granulicella cerasi]